LDGWRGVSIILVLATHLLPLGPSSLKLNDTSGAMGMALFFSLSGFLISHFLIRDDNLVRFITRRTFRIVPLAWLYLVIALPFLGIPPSWYVDNFLFIANWPPMELSPGISHFWSLCIEMQFYFGIAILYYLFGSRALYLCVFIGLLITLNRYYHQVPIAINTYYRMDEILSGVLLALVYYKRLGTTMFNLLTKLNPVIMLLLYTASCHPDSGLLNYFRPYFAVMLVGSTLVQPSRKFNYFLHNNILIYIASISYALYVIHPILTYTWLGTGDILIKYLKRPLLFLVLFIMAHISTYYYERYWINLSRRIA
jgi:peptidoglycan/LPS O-acetylase OafA/YrhL